MKAGNAAIELSERRVAQEVEAGVARVRAALAGTSGVLRTVCDCGEPISEARRRAVPNTDKCVDCAMGIEKGRRRA
ncbi:TraR/DksA C4-type zinc finger protein [Chelativorans alearense]|uniref:TraR/DksA C4-type zinc finger protein n=1 Tax=Chelativorans alearense TaxID=2681495 RepID=UPI0013D8B49B|nr:TraR/DksA C4-type zinc finger protein [Chelativorans alearense]